MKGVFKIWEHVRSDPKDSTDAKSWKLTFEYLEVQGSYNTCTWFFAAAI